MKVGEESERPCDVIWKLEPVPVDSMDDSTDGNGGISDMSGGGGVSVFCKGDAV